MAAKLPAQETKGRLQILTDRVVKAQGPDAAHLECVKTVEGERLGRSTGLFRVPRVLGHDSKKGVLVLERIPNLCGLAEAVQVTGRADLLLSRAGRALAAIHQKLRLPESMMEAGAAAFLDACFAEQSWLHGDFSAWNVAYSLDSDELIILDWSSAPWLGDKPFARGPPTIDVSIMLLSLFCIRPTQGSYWAWGAAKHFLNAYGACTERQLDEALLERTIMTILGRFVPYRGRQIGALRLLAHAPAFLTLASFGQYLRLARAAKKET